MRKYYTFTGLKLFLPVLFISGFCFLPGCSSESDNPTEPAKNEPNAILAPPVLYFGQIPEGQTAVREFLIYNDGKAPLLISEMKIEGTDAALFSLADGGGEITVPVNKILSFAVNFDPLASGDFSAQVSITSNAKSSPDVQALNGKTTGADGTTFERIIGKFGSDNGGKIRLLDDGGMIIAGSSYNQEEDENQATLFRLDQFGNLIWHKQYPVAGIASFGGMTVTANGNIVCTGTTRTGSVSNSDAFALSVSDNGDILWEQVYELGGSQPDNGNDIIKTRGGGFMICGATKNTDDVTGGVKDALLIKIDNSGVYEWHKVYGTTEGEEATSLQQTKNGEYILAGSTTVPSQEPGGDFDFYLVKTDEDGNILWSKSFGGSNYDFASSILIDENSDYVIAGYTASFGAGGRDYWIVKTDSSGKELWNQTYGGPANDTPGEIIGTSDGGYYIVGGSASFASGENGMPSGQVWVIKTGSDGSKLWDRLYGGVAGEGGSSAQELSNGGFIISGSTGSYSESNDVYVLKTNDDGSI